MYGRQGELGPLAASQVASKDYANQTEGQPTGNETWALEVKLAASECTRTHFRGAY